ncbi:Tellurite resistance protein TehA [Tepidimonas alkaliphilus]|uniref:Tellurite resistance protein TehA n=1 Tax=Tepidimonas alkaliphilus TaxID=2588942 RepID=A0A554WBR7_9BURK|nr:SLAC1 anion channel family protein [Tepidimonas alkaliphilus]TSE21018.1 Tellurite resistance protein TehA [Tepidimonas alkaliphilus]
MASSPHATPLKFLHPGWFTLVMGLAGLALAWHAAGGVLGPWAEGVALTVGALAAAVWLALLLASLWRWQRHPAAVTEDLRHPVRHGFVAAMPVGLLLLATWLQAFELIPPVAQALWWAGSIGQLSVTVWVLGRWLAPTVPHAPDAQSLWNGVTPVLYIPVVGNVVAPLAGVGFGHELWSAVHFGIGMFFWPVVFTLLVARRLAHGPMPPRLQPTWFISLAPAAVGGLGALRFGWPLGVAAAFWGLGLFMLLWVGTQARRYFSQPFALPFWAVSFPLAAFTSLTFKLAAALGHPGLQLAALALLALASVVIVTLTLATLKGLRDGTLLAPEPAAPVVAASP